MWNIPATSSQVLLSELHAKSYKRSEIQHRNTKLPRVTFSKASCFVSLLNFQSVNSTISAGFNRFMGLLLARLLLISVWGAHVDLLFQMVLTKFAPQKAKNGTKTKPTTFQTQHTGEQRLHPVVCRCLSFPKEHFQVPFHVNFWGCK